MEYCKKAIILFQKSCNLNFIDVAFKIGQRSTDYVSFDDEKYYKVVLSLVSGERWFLNERKK